MFIISPNYKRVMNNRKFIERVIKMILKIEAADGVVIKEIQHGQVKTRTIIDGKDGYTKTNDIKRLGFKTTEEYIEHLKAQGYEKAGE